MTKQQAIHYTIKPTHPEAHLFTITCHIEKPDPQGQQFQLPNWIPGSYMIRDFAKNIISFKAVDSANNKLEYRKLNKSCWQVQACDSGITIQYEIYAWDLSVRSAHLDTTHGFFNGTSVFLAVVGQEHSPCSVDIQKPDGNHYNNWRVATSLESLESAQYSFGFYQAENYDELIDHPVEMGTFDVGTFHVNNIQHDIVLTGKHRADIPKLCEDLKVICQTHADFFGELPDIKHYLFLTMVVGKGYGGLEHRSSTSLLCSRNDLPIKDQAQTAEYRNFLGLCSHEYFHTWNVKRIKPEAYLSCNLDKEVYTEQLWAFEGITSYYDELALVRSKIITEEQYLEMLGKTITRVLRGNGRNKQSVAESSFDTWTRFYQQDESALNNIVSYYAKGSLIALGLDFEIRKATNNKKSLDVVMQILWSQHGKKGIGVPEKMIETLASEIAGEDLSRFFETVLYGTQDLALDDYFNSVGIGLHSYIGDSIDNAGGVKNKADTEDDKVTSIGARVVKNPLGAKLSHVFDNGNAQKSGLSAGDIVIAIDNIQVTKSSFEKTAQSYPPDSNILIHAFRRDELMLFSLQTATSPKDTFYLEVMDNPNEVMLNNKRQWLNII
ncbi:Putative protease [hydrothermal vent metagenome]|uniref:Protease n=1 Tax=hydrothermal vent metagenome TaxID=652676 RepID=A0A3B1A8Z7_9ZZZZ